MMPGSRTHRSFPASRARLPQFLFAPSRNPADLFCPSASMKRLRRNVGLPLPMISLVDAQTLDAVIGLFEAQLQEHGITTSSGALRMVAQTVIADRRYGFMLVARSPDGDPIGVAYASALLSLEHGGVSGWL